METVSDWITARLAENSKPAKEILWDFSETLLADLPYIQSVERSGIPMIMPALEEKPDDIIDMLEGRFGYKVAELRPARRQLYVWRTTWSNHMANLQENFVESKVSNCPTLGESEFVLLGSEMKEGQPIDFAAATWTPMSKDTQLWLDNRLMKK